MKQFKISSNGLCFGFKKDIALCGIKKDSVQVPHLNKKVDGDHGTVLFQKWDYTMKSLNGNWTAYPLLREGGNEIMAWFASHESIQDPRGEVERILKVANSPYEDDNAKSFNDEETWNGRVLVINRYDWNLYKVSSEENLDNEPWENALGLVDFQFAKTNPKSEWFTSSHGVYMPLDGEYAFARFGLVEDRSAVQSFIWFTTNSEMSKLHFPNDDDHKVYTPLTEEARYEKAFSTGKFLGLDYLRTSNFLVYSKANLNGPFQTSILSMTRLRTSLHTIHANLNFEPRLEEHTHMLFNEMLCSWLYRTAEKSRVLKSRQEFITNVFPRHAEANSFSLDKMVTQRLMTDNAAEDVDVEMKDKIVKFLGESHPFWSVFPPKNVTYTLHYLLGEALELAGNQARDNNRKLVVPRDIRVAICCDSELFSAIGMTKAFFPSDMC